MVFMLTISLAYDSIYKLGFEIPFYGDHISLFTLLMCISTLMYTHMNSQMSGNQMPGNEIHDVPYANYVFRIL